MTAKSVVSSNAFNYLDFMKSSVDARTGQYTLSLDLPELKANGMSGPGVPLKLDFNPLNPDDTGYGIGWNLRLSQYTPHNGIVTLHSGESFKVTANGPGGELHMQEKKLNSFRLFQIDSSTWRVVHKSGMVEVLRLGGNADQRVALPEVIYAPSGHSISLKYEEFRGGQRLTRISDANGDLLRIDRYTSEVRLLLPPFDDQPLTRFQMKLTSDRVMEIVMPVAEQASWRFDYVTIRGFTCIKSVGTPLGASEVLDYRDDGHPYPGNVARPNLPRVTHHQVYTGPDSPLMESRYDYSERNFLGFGAPIQWEDVGLDQLYKADAGYSYYTTVEHMLGDKIARTVKHTYNRFHLQTEERITRGKNLKITAITYHAIDQDFEHQPAWFQLPKTVETRWEIDGDPTKARSETEFSEFDEDGNPTLEIRTDGITTRMTYYDKDGEDGCPKDPDGFVRNIKESIVTPAADARGDAPSVITRYRYSAHPPVTGSPVKEWLSVSDERVYEVRGEEEVLLSHTERTYYQTPTDPQRHGRPLQQIDSLNGTRSTTDFSYNPARVPLLDEDTLEIVETFTGFDGVTRTVTRHESLVHGEPLIAFDENDVQIQYSYDSLGRLTHETVAPGTAYAATRVYAHQLVSSTGQRASQTITDVKKQRTRTWFDGLGRAVLSESNSGSGWKTISSAVYDGLGQLTEETSHDWLGERQVIRSTRHEYDDWGQVCRSTGPDGVVQVSDRSPFGKGGDLLRTWKESNDKIPVISEITLVQYNRYDKVDWTERHGAEDKVIGRQVFIYNGYGECIRSDEELAEETLATHFEYDPFRRVVCTRLPGGAVVERSFAEHSRNELPTSIRVIPGNTERPALLLGTQTFDGLERLTSLTVGPRFERYHYDDHKMRVDRRTTPAGKSIRYVYEEQLGDLPKEIIAPDGTSTFAFDKEDAGVASASNNAGNREYFYNADGHLRLERWTDASGSYETTYDTSLLGLPLSRTENGVATLYEYDDIGRLELMTQGQLQAEFEYDSSGRQHRTTTRDLGSGDSLVSENHYDSFGRVEWRTLQLNDSPQRCITHVWREDDQLLSRHYQMDGRSLLLESFLYDQRGRMEQHNCSGERLPTDRYGNAIVAQLFRFDDLDNIERCLTSFANGEENLARFTYAEDDHCQLIQVHNSYVEGGYPTSQTFTYDDDGNQLNDEQGQALSYDTQGRLLVVTSADGNHTVARYRYDGHQDLVTARYDDEAEETLRFYQGYRLSYTVRDGVQVHYFSDGSRALGQQQLGDHQRTLLLLTGASPSVIAESLAASVREAAYSAYGEQQDDLRLDSLMGFNSEVREPGSGWYLLGRGYRAYNPTLMRFHSPDNRSPFHEGGLNCYLYGLGNPVRFSDPSGHRARGMNEDVDYIAPVEQPKKKKGWDTWLPVGLMILGLVVTAIAVPWSAPALSVGFITGMAALATSTAGVAAGVIGTLTEDQRMMQISTALTGVGMLLSFGGATFGSKLLVQSKVLVATKKHAHAMFDIARRIMQPTFMTQVPKKMSLMATFTSKFSKMVTPSRLLRALTPKANTPPAAGSSWGAGTAVPALSTASSALKPGGNENPNRSTESAASVPPMQAHPQVQAAPQPLSQAKVSGKPDDIASDPAGAYPYGKRLAPYWIWGK